MKSLIYTRTGDAGTTGLVGGARVKKDDIRLEAYGTIDELNSYIGKLIVEMGTDEQIETLTRVQHKLFSVGGYLATDQSQTELKVGCRIESCDIERLENQIDIMDSTLPRLKAFILPGGSQAAATAHICRTVCRRAERRILSLNAHVEIDPLLLCFVNRLSDYLYVLARKLCVKDRGNEIIWEKHFDD